MWLVPDRVVKGKSQKGLKDNQGWEKAEKPVFLKKEQPTCFFNPNVCVFLKRNMFLSFEKKHKNPILNCSYWIMQCHHFQNYTIITCYTYYGIQIWGQRNVCHLWFRKALLVNLLQSGKACQERKEQTEKSHSHTNSAVSRQVYVQALLVQHLYRGFFQNVIRYGPISETALLQRRQNID